MKTRVMLRYVNASKKLDSVALLTRWNFLVNNFQTLRSWQRDVIRSHGMDACVPLHRGGMNTKL
jgi:hypothetical protein